MTTIGQIEKRTQERVVRLFRDRLGYDYLGNRIDRPDNANIEQGLLRGWLRKQGIEEALIGVPVPDVDNPVNVGRLIRAYDP